MASKRTEVKVGRYTVSLSNLDKVFYPETGFTKGDVISYYRAVAEVLLPHTKDRFFTLKRYPDGVTGEVFYQKKCPDHRPDFVKTAPLGERDGKPLHYCVINNEASLVWAANLGSLELHTGLARVTTPEKPRALVFDLDPGEPATIVECVEVGFLLKEIFDELGLEAFPKTSGSKGLQIFVPLNTATTFEATAAFAHGLALGLEESHPDLVVSKQARAERPGKVLVDWSQNAVHKTTASAYSLRAKDRPTASTPVTWDEAHKALKAGDPAKLRFEHDEVLARLKKKGDLFEPVLTLKQKLPTLSALD
jgi:bifunctional non-homologous end joining protein LigD